MTPTLKQGKYASYLSIREFKDEYKPIKTVKIRDGVYVDYDNTLKIIIGIEFLGGLDTDIDIDALPPKGFKYEGSSI